MSEQTVNLPQLVIVILVGVFAVRYFLFSGSNTISGSNRNISANNLRAREADVERIQQMFPQVSRRNIMWDLQRNGGNVVATTERILSGRGLENPPQSFQPPPPAQTPTTSTPTPAAKPAQPDLITRYNLKAKLAAQEAEAQAQAQAQAAAAVESETKQKQGGQAWSANKGERQALLQKRREEMILAARRKMEEKVKAEKAMSG